MNDVRKWHIIKGIATQQPAGFLRSSMISRLYVLWNLCSLIFIFYGVTPRSPVWLNSSLQNFSNIGRTTSIIVLALFLNKKCRLTAVRTRFASLCQTDCITTLFRPRQIFMIVLCNCGGRNNDSALDRVTPDI